MGARPEKPGRVRLTFVWSKPQDGGVRGQDDRMTIGVFARAADVTTSALRFHGDCGPVRPASVTR
jgi:hypothetical protein